MEIWILPTSLGLLVVAGGLILWNFHQIQKDFVSSYTEVLRSIVKEWNALAQTVNALVTTLPEGGNDVTGHLRASEDGSADVIGMSPSKAALYAARKGKRP